MDKKSILRFSIKLSLLLLIGFVPYFILLSMHIEGSDTFYWKTTHQGDNLIIGDSRVQKGISPSLLKKYLSNEKIWINIAFTGMNSPYGDTYNKFIERKLKKSQTGNSGIFILGIHPGMIMEYSKDRRRREEEFRIFKLLFVNQYPNYEYILRNANGTRPLLNELFFGKEKEVKIHRDGWVEYIGQLEKPQLFNKKVIFDRSLVQSTYREEKLIELINSLEEYGKVFLVRLPVNAEIKVIEDEYAPYFQTFVLQIASGDNVYYLDYSDVGDDFEFYDYFHHLNGRGAQEFNKLLAKDIKTLM